MRHIHLHGVILLTAVMASATATATARTYNDYLVVSEAKKAAAGDMPNPKSVRFRGLFLSEHGDSKVTLCGEINAKDRTGKYTGFRRFLVEDTRETLFDPVEDAGARSEPSMMKGIFDRAYRRMCSDKIKDVK